MKIVILGAGQVGGTVAEHLSSEQNDITLIDKDSHRLRELQDRFDIRTVRGMASHPDVMRQAGADDADMLIAVTNSDHVNLKVSISSKLLNPDLPVYSRSEIHDVGVNMESFGTDVIVNPFDIFADRLAMAVHSPARYVIHDWLTSPALLRYWRAMNYDLGPREQAGLALFGECCTRQGLLPGMPGLRWFS